MKKTSLNEELLLWHQSNAPCQLWTTTYNVEERYFQRVNILTGQISVGALKQWSLTLKLGRGGGRAR